MLELRTDNAAGSRFCNQCATPLSKRCAKCAFENAPEAKFCAQCSAPLDAAGSVRAEAEPRDGLTGERRHLTVLFCDLVNSTGIAAQLDPEEWREIVAGYHRAAAQAIERFGGSVAQYLGDGVMAYFGWPEAHDNDAERAARAGLAIQEAITKLNEHPARPKLAARVGIDSGRRLTSYAAIPAGPEWLRWKCRRVHPALAYEPCQPEVLENGDYNKWRRGCAPHHGDVSAFIALVDHLFAGKPPKEREWFLRWCAYPIQHPGTKLFSAVVVFGSTQGSGKSLQGEMLCGVYGEKNSVEIDRNTLGSTFNSWSAEKQFVLANEISDRKDLRLDADSLKNYISRDGVLVNEKYQPRYSIRDCANYFFTSNHRAPIYTDDEDRRYFYLHVEGKLPVEISSVLRSWKDRPKRKYTNGEGFGPLHQYLLDLDLGDFDRTAAALQTLDRETVIQDSGSDLDRWCQDLKADPMPFLRAGSDNFKPRDLWRIEELVSVFKVQKGRHVSEKALVGALRGAKFLELGRTRTRLGRVNLWAIGNPDRWRTASESERSEEYAKGFQVNKLDQLVQS